MNKYIGENRNLEYKIFIIVFQKVAKELAGNFATLFLWSLYILSNSNHLYHCLYYSLPSKHVTEFVVIHVSLFICFLVHGSSSLRRETILLNVLLRLQRLEQCLELFLNLFFTYIIYFMYFLYVICVYLLRKFLIKIY